MSAVSRCAAFGVRFRRPLRQLGRGRGRARASRPSAERGSNHSAARSIAAADGRRRRLWGSVLLARGAVAVRGAPLH